jgi:hypothetical protein
LFFVLRMICVSRCCCILLWPLMSFPHWDVFRSKHKFLFLHRQRTLAFQGSPCIWISSLLKMNRFVCIALTICGGFLVHCCWSPIVLTSDFERFFVQELICCVQELLTAVDAEQWTTLAKRRVQHYGYEFLYKVHLHLF